MDHSNERNWYGHGNRWYADSHYNQQSQNSSFRHPQQQQTFNNNNWSPFNNQPKIYNNLPPDPNNYDRSHPYNNKNKINRNRNGNNAEYNTPNSHNQLLMSQFQHASSRTQYTNNQIQHPTTKNEYTKYNIHESSYQNLQPRYQRQQPSYQNKQPSYQNQIPSKQNQQPGYQTQIPSKQNQQPSYQNQQSSYKTQQPSYQNQKPSYQTQQPSYQTQQPSYQNQQPSYQTQEPSQNIPEQPELPKKPPKRDPSSLPKSIAFISSVEKEEEGEQDNAVTKDQATNSKQKKRLFNCNRRATDSLVKGLAKPVQGGIAQRMMEKMGWTGGGLGVKEDGILEPIAPDLHLEKQAGLGHVEPKQKKPEKKKVPEHVIIREDFDPNTIIESLMKITESLNKKAIAKVKKIHPPPSPTKGQRRAMYKDSNGNQLKNIANEAMDSVEEKNAVKKAQLVIMPKDNVIVDANLVISREDVMRKRDAGRSFWETDDGVKVNKNMEALNFLKGKKKVKRKLLKHLRNIEQKGLNANVLEIVLKFVRDPTKHKLIFDSKLSRKERRLVHRVFSCLRNDEEFEMDELDEEVAELLDQIEQYNEYQLFSQSLGENPYRYLHLFKEAPEHVYLITHDDLMGETKTTEAEKGTDVNKDTDETVNIEDNDDNVIVLSEDEEDSKSDNKNTTVTMSNYEDTIDRSDTGDKPIDGIDNVNESISETDKSDSAVNVDKSNDVVIVPEKKVKVIRNAIIASFYKDIKSDEGVKSDVIAREEKQANDSKVNTIEENCSKDVTDALVNDDANKLVNEEKSQNIDKDKVKENAEVIIDNSTKTGDEVKPQIHSSTDQDNCEGNTKLDIEANNDNAKIKTPVKVKDVVTDTKSANATNVSTETVKKSGIIKQHYKASEIPPNIVNTLPHVQYIPTDKPLPTVGEISKKLKDFFKEFLENDEFTELRFLGELDDLPVEEFLNEVQICIDFPDNSVNIFGYNIHGCKNGVILEIGKDMNGGDVIYKVDTRNPL